MWSWNNWKLYGVLVLACLQIVTAWGWSSDHRALNAERISHKADIETYKRAQKEAQDKIDIKKKQLEQESKVKADAADEKYSILLAKYHTSLLRYKTSPSVRSGPSSGEQPQTSESGYGPSSSAELPTSLTISGTDAQICAVNTARLQAVHDWAIELK